jgi:hypothetical protein
MIVLNILTYSPLFGQGSREKINQNVRVTGEAHGKCFKAMGGFLFKFYHQMSYTCPKVPLQVNFFRWRHFAFPSMSLIFLRLRTLFMHRWPILPLYNVHCTILASKSTNECKTITLWPVLNRTLAFELRTDKSAAWHRSCTSQITMYINLPLKDCVTRWICFLKD